MNILDDKFVVGVCDGSVYREVNDCSRGRSLIVIGQVGQGSGSGQYGPVTSS